MEKHIKTASGWVVVDDDTWFTNMKTPQEERDQHRKDIHDRKLCICGYPLFVCQCIISGGMIWN